MTLKELRAKRKAALDAAAGILDAATAAENRALTDEERTQVDAHLAEAAKLKADAKVLEADETRRQQVVAAQAESAGRQTPETLAPAAPAAPAAAAQRSREQAAGPRFVMPATAACGTLRNFTEPAEAYAFGRWIMAAVFGSEASRQYCQEHSLAIERARMDPSEERAAAGNVNTAGGYLVPAQFDRTIIALVEAYGVFRRNARNVAMTSDRVMVPRRVSGLTAYWVTDNAAITESQKGWGGVELIARKLGVLTKHSSELGEDAIISLADDLAGEIALAFSQKEDECGFIGDGTATYSGIVGVMPKMNNASAIGIVTQGTTNTWSSMVLGDFNNVVAKVPAYALRGSKWYCSSPFWAGVMQKLMYAAGGNTVEMIAGSPGRTFLGYPVELTEVMPSVTAVTTLTALFGNLPQAAMFGNRRGVTVAASEHLNFAEDEIAIRGTERFDIKVHDIGTSAVRGPMACLKSGT